MAGKHLSTATLAQGTFWQPPSSLPHSSWRPRHHKGHLTLWSICPTSSVPVAQFIICNDQDLGAFLDWGSGGRSQIQRSKMTKMGTYSPVTHQFSINYVLLDRALQPQQTRPQQGNVEDEPAKKATSKVCECEFYCHRRSPPSKTVFVCAGVSSLWFSSCHPMLLKSSALLRWLPFPFKMCGKPVLETRILWGIGNPSLLKKQPRCVLLKWLLLKCKIYRK